ncbi:MAG: acyltransferase [Bacteroidia bacterium]|nr:acyltransferase [Bacteroidia bacterium]
MSRIEPINAHVTILDSLRAFAALSVCTFHFVCTTTGFINTKWILSLFSIGQYGVQTFFVISGFVIPWSMYNAGFKIKNFFSFFLKRLSRLEPPYLFSLTIAIVILFLRNTYYSQIPGSINLSGMQIFLHFGYLIPFFENYKWLNVVYWTLAVEFQYYFFMALLFLPLIKSKLMMRYCIYLMIFGLSFFSDREFLLYWLPIFFLGVLLFLKMTNLISSKEYFVVTLFTLCFSFYKYPPLLVVFSILPVLFVLFYKNLKIYILDGIGKFSYSLYLVHTIIGATFINVLSHYADTILLKIVVILFGFLISILSSWITYRIVEKPSKRLSASIKYK